MNDRRESDDEGMTLVELIVTVVVGAVVLTLIAITFVSGFTAQRDGVARDSATGAANLVATSVSMSIRNSTVFRVNDEGTRVDATYVAPDGTPQCRAWELLLGGTLVYRSDSSGALPAADASWAPLATGVVGTLDAGAVFAEDGGKSLRIGMEITMDQVAVAVTDGVTAQAVSGGGLQCFS